MARCPACGAEIASGSRFCGACGAPLGVSADTSAPTALHARPASGGGIEARFLPGAVLAGRYRIVALIGKGGMGEVYRADDLKLGQAVALKFLPEALSRDESRVGRLFSEVRTARQVAHANVCRVYDLGEVDGQHFLSMEYVDGEDLATLLRRIGRLPKDKAVQVARQLCAGLAAAHDQGILHRDLKPANVMIDGRGRVRITDFGLAAVAVDVKGAEVRMGTPTYMAPEQIQGREVSVRSDLYALGLVLYELFTGKPAFRAASVPELRRLQEESSPASPSSLVEGFDPAVERVILRCLERDPLQRPGSALAVAASLPGGDPLAAALAAGETPDPEVVASAAQVGGLSPAWAWAGLGAFLGCTVAVIVLGGQTQMVRMVNPPKPPQVLADRAGAILASIGHGERPADSVYTFESNDDYLRGRREGTSGIAGTVGAAATRPGLLHFWYRQSPGLIERVSGGSIGTWMADPPMRVPGEARVALDPEGRLHSLLVIPPDRDEPDASGPPEPDWAPLFAAAHRDPAALVPAEPAWTPPVFADRRAAWEGVYPESPATAIRVEAAAFRGRPVAFRIVEPWTRPATIGEPGGTFWVRASRLVRTAWFSVVVIAAGILAARNFRLGRGDRRGALRLALYLGGVRLVWLLGAHHVPAVSEIGVFVAHMAWSAYRICLVWIFYMALEPYARRIWPRMMISWVRLLGGRFRDPLVGRDLLIATLFGGAFGLVVRTSQWLGGRLGSGRLTPVTPEVSLWSLEALRGVRHALTAVAGVHAESVLFAFVGIMLFLVLRLLLRRTWAAVGVMSLLGAVMFNPGPGLPSVALAGILLNFALFWIVLFRAGFLSAMVGFSVNDLLLEMPITFDPSAWYAGAGFLALAVVVGLAVYGFYVSLAGRPLFRDAILEPGKAPA